MKKGRGTRSWGSLRIPEGKIGQLIMANQPQPPKKNVPVLIGFLRGGDSLNLP